MIDQKEKESLGIRGTSFSLTPPNIWCKKLNETIPSQLIENGLKFDKLIGKGEIKYLEIQEGLWLNYVDICLKQELYLTRQAKEINDYFILNFHLSKSVVTQVLKNKTIHSGVDHVSIVLSSSKVYAEINVPSNIPIFIFNVGFSMKWLKNNFLNSADPSFKSIFLKNNPILISESLDYKFKSLITEININKNNNVKLLSNTFQILDYFFTKLKQRSFNPDYFLNIHPLDTKGLMIARDDIESNIHEIKPLAELATLAGMSLTKFKRLFNQVFGQNPYQYFLERRLLTARTLLESKKYTVSEVGHLIGYSNLSQFSKAFKKKFDVLPSELK